MLVDTVQFVQQHWEVCQVLVSLLKLGKGVSVDAPPRSKFCGCFILSSRFYDIVENSVAKLVPSSGGASADR